jgi:hypothetical protein
LLATSRGGGKRRSKLRLYDEMLMRRKACWRLREENF